MLTWQEDMGLAQLLPINEGYGSGTDIQGLAKGLPDLAHRLPSNPQGQGVRSVEDSNLFAHLYVGCWRDAATGRFDLLQPFAAQGPSVS